MRSGFFFLAVAFFGVSAEASWPTSPLRIEQTFEREGDRSEEIASLLFALGDEEAPDAIERAIVDRDPNVRALGARRAELMHLELGSERLKRFLLSQDPAEQALGLRLVFSELEGDTLRLVLKLASSPNGEVRRLVARALALTASAERSVATSVVATLGRDTDEGVRSESAFSLSRLGGSEALMTLEGMLSDPSENVRVAGLRGRCAAGDASALALAFLRDPSWRLRAAAYACLSGKLSDEEFLSSLGSRSSESDPRALEAALAFEVGGEDRANKTLGTFSSVATPGSLERVVERLRRSLDGEAAVVRALRDRKGKGVEGLASALRAPISEAIEDALLEANAEGRLSSGVLMDALVRTQARSDKTTLRTLELLESEGAVVAEKGAVLLARGGAPKALFVEKIAKFASERRFGAPIRRALLGLLIGSSRGVELGKLMSNSTSASERALGRLLVLGGGPIERFREALEEGRERNELVGAIFVHAKTLPFEVLFGILPALPRDERKELLGVVRGRRVLRADDEGALVRALPGLLPSERAMLGELVSVLDCARDRRVFGDSGPSAFLRLQLEHCPETLFENEKSEERGVRVVSLLRLASLELDENSKRRASAWLSREGSESIGTGWMRKALLVAARRFDAIERIAAKRASDDVVERSLARSPGKISFEYETRALLGALSEFEEASYPSLLGSDEEGRRAKLRCVLLARNEHVARRCAEVRANEELVLTTVVGARGAPVRSVPLFYLDAAGVPFLGFSDVEGRMPTFGTRPSILDAALAY